MTVGRFSPAIIPLRKGGYLWTSYLSIYLSTTPCDIYSEDSLFSLLYWLLFFLFYHVFDLCIYIYVPLTLAIMI